MTAISYKVEKSREFPHIEWLELYGDNLMHECAIMRRTPDGSVLFFKTNDLDDTDRKRLATILADRNATGLELWDLMYNRTLGNGMNALAYFNQLVRVLTPSGKIIDPRAGVHGGSVTVTK